MPGVTAMPKVKSVLFGPTVSSFDIGRTPSCAVNANKVVVEVHKAKDNNSLIYRLGDVVGVNVAWRPAPGSTAFSAGNNPSVAMNDAGVVIVMNDISKKLKYSVGTIDGNNLGFKFTGKEFSGNPDDATAPSVAVNRNGVVLEVHESKGSIFYRRGLLTGESISWQQTPVRLMTEAERPFVTINESKAVVVYQHNGQLYLLIGTFDATKTAIDAPISWNMPFNYAAGQRATVAITSDDYVYGSRVKMGVDLVQTMGSVSSGQYQAFTPYLSNASLTLRYDGGSEPQVAVNDRVAVEVHMDSSNKLYASASLLFDRSQWMSDNRATLATRPLKQLVMGASHDAGASTDNRARTQRLEILDQLAYGIRYFDIRPLYHISKSVPGVPDELFTYHTLDVAATISPAGGTFLGQSLVSIVSDLRKFFEQHRELVIIRISQYHNFNQAVFDTLARLLRDTTTGLGNFLYVPQGTQTKRLAERNMSEFLLADRATVLFLCDTDGDTDYLADKGTRTDLDGLYKYRDWYAEKPEDGDVTVFDVFSATFNFNTMATATEDDPNHPLIPGSANLQRGQIPKFQWFDGLCQGRGTTRSTTPCDFFLLSWTITPEVPFFQQSPLTNSVTPNSNLVDYLSRPENAGANRQKQIINMIYTDGVQSSRSVDVALARNGLA